MFRIEEASQRRLAAFLYRRTGNVIPPEKSYLFEGRLSSLLVAQALPGFEALADRVEADPRGPLADAVVEALVTTETSFFRDPVLYEVLRTQILPPLLRSREPTRTLNLWSAAASTGQEAYTLAMLLSESFPLQFSTWNVKILATDVSAAALARAREGRYLQIEVNRGLPALLMVKYLARAGTGWQVVEPLRRRVEFRQMNLCEPWSGVPPMDLVFLRNVMIYMEPETRSALLDRIRRVLRPDGYLFLGGAETLPAGEGFERAPFDRCTCYKPGPERRSHARR